MGAVEPAKKKNITGFCFSFPNDSEHSSVDIHNDVHGY
jgi:hypothetical protein